MTNSDNYYQSHSKLPFIGEHGQNLLGRAKVLVIGAGGLGSPCLLTLAGCGISTIGIADFDTVSATNLHRQTLYNFGDIGYSKTRVAKEVLENHNPYITVKEHHIIVNKSNVLDLLAQYDLIVDGTDNFSVRYLINDACVYLNKPWVYGAIYQSEGHVTVFNYNKSGTLRCLFPEPDVETHVPSCADVGAYNVVTSIIGNLMANEVVKIILQSDDILVNKLATYDALSVSLNRIGYKPEEKNRQISIDRFDKKENSLHVSPDDFFRLSPNGYFLIDVREDWEREEYNIGGKHIPLNLLNNNSFQELPKENKIVVYCQQGHRSEVAVKLLRKLGFENAVSLLGGLNGIGKLTTGDE